MKQSVYSILELSKARELPPKNSVALTPQAHRPAGILAAALQMGQSVTSLEDFTANNNDRALTIFGLMLVISGLEWRHSQTLLVGQQGHLIVLTTAGLVRLIEGSKTEKDS